MEETENQFGLDDHAMDQMLESMRLILRTEGDLASLELSEASKHTNEPLLKLLNEVLTDKNIPIPTQLVFGMELLVSSYKAFLWQEGVSNPINCRITALKFAQEIYQSASTAFDSFEHLCVIESSPLADRHHTLEFLRQVVHGYSCKERNSTYTIKLRGSLAAT